MTTTDLIVLAVWIVSAPLAYLAFRAAGRETDDWTRGDRLVFLVLSAFGGPVSLFFATIDWLAALGHDKPAKW